MKKLLSVYLSDNEVEKIKALAVEQQRSVSNMATVLIRKTLKKYLDIRGENN